MGGQTKRQFSAKNDATGQKMTFFEIFFSVAHLLIENNTFCSDRNLTSSAVQKSWRVKQNVNFRLKMTPQAKKNTFFEIFSSVAHVPIKTKHFYFIKISYLKSFREIKGGQKKHQSSAKNDAAGQKNDFFRISFLLHIYPLK